MKLFHNSYLGSLIVFSSLYISGCGSDSAPAKNADPKLQATLDTLKINGTYNGKTYCDGKSFNNAKTLQIIISNTQVIGIENHPKALNDQPCRIEIRGDIFGVDENQKLKVNQLSALPSGEGCGTFKNIQTKETTAWVESQPDGSYKAHFYNVCILAQKI